MIPHRRSQSPQSCQLNDLPMEWGDRRESNSRRRGHDPPPEPLGHGHIWWLVPVTIRSLRFFRPSLIRLSYPAELWWRTGELNPDLMVAGHPCSRYH